MSPAEREAKDEARETLEQRFEERLGIDVEAGRDFTVRREEDRLIAEPTDRLQRRFAARQRGAIAPAVADPAGLDADMVERIRSRRVGAAGGLAADPVDIMDATADEESRSTEDIREELESRLEQRAGQARAAALGVTDPELRQAAIEGFDLEAGEDFEFTELTEDGQRLIGVELSEDFQAEQQDILRGRLEAQLESEFGVQLDPEEDIKFEETDGEIQATLTERGQRRVEVETAPIVGAAERVGVFEDEARAVAGAAAEFRAFGREQREEVVEPALESIREATGLEEDIEAFEAFSEDVAAAEEELLAPAREAVGDRVPPGLAAGAVAVGTRGAAATGPGAVVAGTALAATGAAETIERLPPEQQLAVGQAVAVATDPVGQAERSVVGAEVDDPETIGIDQPEIQIDPESGVEVFREDIDVIIPELFPHEIGQLDPEQAPPEFEIPDDPRPFSEEFMAIQEDPIFLPELQAPTAPAEEFTAGRHTPPERPVDVDEPTEPFGGPEVPIESEDMETPEDFIFPGPEVPGQSREDAIAEESPEVIGPAEAAPQQAIQRELPRPEHADDPLDVGRERGPAFVIRRSPRVSEEFIIETPTAEIDLALVDPALARVLREGPELTAEDVFERSLQASEPGLDARPGQVQGLGFGDRLDEGASFDPAVDEGLDQVPDLQAPQDTRQVPRTTAVPELVEPIPEFGTPQVTQQLMDEPTVTVTETVQSRPRRPTLGFPLPEFGPSSKRGRPRDIDEFEKEFLEPVIGAEEFIGAGGMDGEDIPPMDLGDDET